MLTSLKREVVICFVTDHRQQRKWPINHTTSIAIWWHCRCWNKYISSEKCFLSCTDWTHLFYSITTSFYWDWKRKTHERWKKMTKKPETIQFIHIGRTNIFHSHQSKIDWERDIKTKQNSYEYTDVETKKFTYTTFSRHSPNRPIVYIILL